MKSYPTGMKNARATDDSPKKKPNKTNEKKMKNARDESTKEREWRERETEKK